MTSAPSHGFYLNSYTYLIIIQLHPNFFPTNSVKKPSASSNKITLLRIPHLHTSLLSDNSLPNNKILDCSKLKAFTDDKINVTKKLKFWFGKDRKHCGKRRKCWLPAFSPFPTMFSKAFISLQGC